MELAKIEIEPVSVILDADSKECRNEAYLRPSSVDMVESAQHRTRLSRIHRPPNPPPALILRLHHLIQRTPRARDLRRQDLPPRVDRKRGGFLRPARGGAGCDGEGKNGVDGVWVFGGEVEAGEEGAFRLEVGGGRGWIVGGGGRRRGRVWMASGGRVGGGSAGVGGRGGSFERGGKVRKGWKHER
jgi:hypothetical protein